MVSFQAALSLCLAVAVAGCVAPEAPPVPRLDPVSAARPAVSTAGYEDAPLPNRKLGTPAADSVVRVAH